MNTYEKERIIDTYGLLMNMHDHDMIFVNTFGIGMWFGTALGRNLAIASTFDFIYSRMLQEVNSIETS